MYQNISLKSFKFVQNVSFLYHLLQIRQLVVCKLAPKTTVIFRLFYFLSSRNPLESSDLRFFCFTVFFLGSGNRAIYSQLGYANLTHQLVTHPVSILIFQFSSIVSAERKLPRLLCRCTGEVWNFPNLSLEYCR